jgi:hypothetical protein
MGTGRAWGTWAIAGAVLAVVPACGDSGGEEPETVDCDRQPPLDWDNFGEGFFSLLCTSFHSAKNSDVQRSGAPIGLDFDTYGQVVREVSRIETETTGPDAAMPPSGGEPQQTDGTTAAGQCRTKGRTRVSGRPLPAQYHPPADGARDARRCLNDRQARA